MRGGTPHGGGHRRRRQGRARGIRREIVALVLLPLVGMVALWGTSTAVTGSEAVKVLDASDVLDDFIPVVVDALSTVQSERAAALDYLADRQDARAHDTLRRKADATDAKIADLGRLAEDAELRGKIHGWDVAGQAQQVAKLKPLRSAVEAGTISGREAYRRYNAQADGWYRLYLQGSKAISQGGGISGQLAGLAVITQSREAVLREGALLGWAVEGGRVTAADQREVAGLVAQRALSVRTSGGLLEDADRERLKAFWSGPPTASLRSAERKVLAATPGTGAAQDPELAAAARSVAVASPRLDKKITDLNFKSVDDLVARAKPVSVRTLVIAGVTGVVGLIAVIASLVISVRVARRIIRQLGQLRLQARESADVRLPDVVRRLGAGQQVDVDAESPRRDHPRSEIGHVGEALQTLERAAMRGAVVQADLRRGISEVFVNLARRHQALLHRQLTLLDTMERRTDNDDELADLFRLDHMTTRMRRHADGLVILSGAGAPRHGGRPVPLLSVIRGAIGEVEDFERIDVPRLPEFWVRGPAVADLTHLIAELLENATIFSPPGSTVQLACEGAARGLTLEIHDRGLGVPSDERERINQRLAAADEIDPARTDRLGLLVVSRLAHRQGVTVSLRASPYGGTTAVVLVPRSVLTAPEEGAGETREGLDNVFAVPAREPAPAGRLAPPPPAVPPTAFGIPAPPTAPPTVHDPAAAGTGAVRPAPQGVPLGSAGIPHQPGRRNTPSARPERGHARGAAPAPLISPDETVDGLPRRVRQASLAPQLRRRAAESATASERPAERDADEVRERMQSMQSGWQRARDTDD
ncbi:MULTISPECIES: sensor histidine kinase [unclassified Streptomyces]|uniref:sensor histidine kinase n=1 Tax=unclassified Streptomyces TaxID=2593676 RepID=UPI002E1832B1